MRSALAVALALAAGAALAGAAQAAPRLVIRDAAVSIVVEPENRSDIAVDVYRPNPRLPLEVRREFGGDTVINGHLPRFWTTCHGSGDGLHVLVFGRGDYGISQMPQVLVHAPLDTVIESGGIVHGAVARSRSLTLEASGCGDWTVANVAGQLNTGLSGVGDVRTGGSRSAEVALSGTGHLSVGDVQTQLVAHLSGAGSLTTRSAGAADLSISGSGGLTTGPIAGPLMVHISGAGSLKAASAGGPVTADVSGVGSVSVARVTGSVNQHVSGIGSVHVGDR